LATTAHLRGGSRVPGGGTWFSWTRAEEELHYFRGSRDYCLAEGRRETGVLRLL